MFPVSLGIAFVIWAFWRLDDKAEALQKLDGRAGSRSAENETKPNKKAKLHAGVGCVELFLINSEAPALGMHIYFFVLGSDLPGLPMASLWELSPEVTGEGCKGEFIWILIVTGTAIRQLREAKHLTQAELAEKLARQRKGHLQSGRQEFPIVKDTTPNMMNPRLYTTSYNKPQGQQFDDTAVLSFIKLQYT
ncbi:MAG: helix-turn-helix domain-containing protein [Faecalibacterium prausnitzii]